MNVLSLFDGMSCGQLALQRAGVKYDNYFASEIDKHAIKVTQHNFPNTKQLGDVRNVRAQDLPKIDLLIGGSPCQGFSFAGKQLNFEDPRSKLFFEFVRLKNELNPRYFLLENVRMKKSSMEVITQHLGVEPIEINSALVSAQNRRRLYWTNIPNITQPLDRGILLRDILEDNISEKFYLKGSHLKWWTENRDFQLAKKYSAEDPDKAICLTARGYNSWNGNYIKQLNPSKESGGKQPYMQNRVYDSDGKSVALTQFSNRLNVLINPASIIGRRLNEDGHRDDYNKDLPINQCLQVKHSADKSGTLTTVEKDNLLSTLPPGRYENAYTDLKEGLHYRKLTVTECERLQTVPDNYTLVQGVSDSQRYKMLGNGWTIDVIAHIFKPLNH